MYTGFQHLHSYTAYLVLALLVVAVGYGLNGWLGNKPYSSTSKKISLSALIVTHIQFLIGLVVYVISPVGITNFSGDAMGDAMARLYMLEHPLTMIIAIGVITWGYSKGKKIEDDTKKFKTITIFYGIGLVLMLSRIPWDAWI